ncbi:hypothetical protein [Zhongshania sp.]|uniref:hypothetical protein n=1 Tax=Zhongshania sp. TaxID=1971902 RepID=UPI0035625ABD
MPVVLVFGLLSVIVSAGILLGDCSVESDFVLSVAFCLYLLRDANSVAGEANRLQCAVLLA